MLINTNIAVTLWLQHVITTNKRTDRRVRNCLFDCQLPHADRLTLYSIQHWHTVYYWNGMYTVTYLFAFTNGWESGTASGQKIIPLQHSLTFQALSPMISTECKPAVETLRFVTVNENHQVETPAVSWKWSLQSYNKHIASYLGATQCWAAHSIVEDVGTRKWQQRAVSTRYWTGSVSKELSAQETGPTVTSRSCQCQHKILDWQWHTLC